MNLQQLKVLVLLAKHKKMTAVAEILNIKQPTVTFHMKKLEEVAGVPLFQQRYKHILLTDAGEALFHYASRIVAWAEEAEHVLSDYRHFKKGTVIIGASNTPATYLLPPMLGYMQDAYPMVQILLHVKNSPQILDMLNKFEIDFGIIAEYEVDHPDLIATPLADDEMGLVMHPGHRLAQSDQVPLDLLRSERFILREKGSASRRMSEEWAAANDFQFQIGMELGATEAIKQSIMSELGISILSRLAVAREVTEGKLAFRKIPPPSLSRHMYLVYNRNRFLTPIVQDFIHFFQLQSDNLRQPKEDFHQ
ncbi:MAG: LysR substrate-binding domain-containing protein [Desulfitobacteriaceae bacterium]